MTPRPLAGISAFLIAATLVVPALAASTLEREFRYPAGAVSLTPRDGMVEVDLPNALREFVPGSPDLPWTSERVTIPIGTRVSGVEVVAIETAPLAEGVRLPTSIRVAPGLGPFERTPADPAFYGRPGFQPDVPVVLGAQGFERGEAVATLRVCPVRWSAVSGRLERVARLRVRLTLEPTEERPVSRDRVVPEWEVASGPGRRALRAGTGSRADGGSRGAERFSPTQLPSVLGSPVAYVIITNEAMAPEFQRLADWKTRSGIPAVVRTLSFIQQEYLSGTDDADRMRMFIRDAYARWGTLWVLLGGDTDVIPARITYTTYFGGEHIPADLYYSSLDGNWNADRDSVYGEGPNLEEPVDDACDLFPEVYVGRAPTSTLAQAQQFVDKTLQYETNPVGDYERNILFFAEVLFPQNWVPGQLVFLDGATLAEEVLPSVRMNPSIHYARLYENYTDPTWEPGALPETRAAVLDSLNRGYNYGIHIGHGYRNVMSVGDANLINADAAALTNGNRLMNLYAIDCTSNAIDFPSIGEAFLKAANGGAVTNVGSTRFDYPVIGRYFQREFFRLLYDDSVTAVGELQARQKLPFISSSNQDNAYRWTEMTLLLLGDPELHVWTGTPRTLTVTAPSAFVVSDSTLLVHVAISGTPLEGARVVAYRPNDELSIATTDASGDASLSFRPDSLGEFNLTVTGYDCRPYQGVVPIVASSEPVLADLPCVVDDDNLGGTSGNGNGVVDAGEVVDLLVSLRNNGGSGAPGVTGSLTTTDGLVSITGAEASYGTIAAGATASPSNGFRVSVPYTVPDQHEFPFQLTLLDGSGRHFAESFALTARAPDPRHFSHVVLDLSGNGDGRPDPGETVSYFVKLKNLGTGIGPGVTAVLRSLDGLCTVTDSTAAFGDLAPGQEKQGDAFAFTSSSALAVLQLRVSDAYGLLSVQAVDLGYPSAPGNLAGQGFASTIELTWSHGPENDVLGYNIWESASLGGPYARLNGAPTDRTAYALAEGLLPLTYYYFKVSAVDSSGNESAQSAPAVASTSPPSHAVFPIPMGRETPSSVAVAHLYPGYAMDIVAGAEVLYVWHPDGTAPVDADGAGTTSGDFTTRGKYYAAGPAIADLDGDGSREIVATTWDSLRAYVFDLAGAVKPGWPVVTGDSWSAPAIGDLDNDGVQEIAFASNSSYFYVFKADGQEWMDGDGNAGTTGVFKVMGQNYNFSTPALADLDDNGVLDIIVGSRDGKLYAWRPDGSNLPGFPVVLGSPIIASPAVGYLDGPGDTQLEIAVSAANDSVYVFTNTGVRRPGWPIRLKTSGTSKAPSPALADMNGDDHVDVVWGGTDGVLYVFEASGAPISPVNGVRYSTLTEFASESSPVVADINGDGTPDVVMGDEAASLNAISGLDGSVLAGFPIQLDGEVRGTPALCDCDGDGKSEIVVAGWDKNLYVWDYDFPFSPSGQPPWPQFHHDAMRTGLTTNPPFVDVENPRPSASPRRIEFAPPQPNPARAQAQLAYAVPADQSGAPCELAIYDLTGRRIQTLAHGAARPGRYTTVWDLRGPEGGRVGTGVYFLRFTLGSRSLTRKLVVLH